MVTAPILSIIIVSYNTREMTLECLRSIYAETQTAFELIVVDNASSDGSAQAIAQEFPETKLFAESENHGFAKANNIAAQHARAPYILLLNPDTIVLDGALDALYAFALETPEAKIWGGRTFYDDGSLNPASCWQRITLWNLFCRATGLTGIGRSTTFLNPEAYGGWDRGDARAVDIVSGCLFLISKTSWDALGGFDPIFVMYGEEADLCHRARIQLNADPHVTPTARIVHHGGASEAVRADKMVRLNRAKMELIKRYLPAWQQPLASILYAAWPMSRSLAYRLVDSKSAQDWAEVWKRRHEWMSGFGKEG